MISAIWTHVALRGADGHTVFIYLLVYFIHLSKACSQLIPKFVPLGLCAIYSEVMSELCLGNCLQWAGYLGGAVGHFPLARKKSAMAI